MIKRHDSPVVQTVSRMIIPLIQMFGLYVLFHGHHSPGGGFQGGVLVGASFILMLLIGTKAERKEFHIKNEFLLGSAGILLYAGIGVLAILDGDQFLNYGQIRALGNSIPWRRFYGILGIELGVLIVVAVTVIIIFHVLAIKNIGEER